MCDREREREGLHWAVGLGIILGALIACGTFLVLEHGYERELREVLQEEQLPIPSTIRMTQWPLASEGPEPTEYMYELILSYTSADKDELIRVRKRIQKALR